MASAPINEVAGLSYHAKKEVDWSIVVIIFAGILVLIVLITVFFIIPHYVQKVIDNQVQSTINNFSR